MEMEKRMMMRSTKEWCWMVKAWLTDYLLNLLNAEVAIPTIYPIWSDSLACGHKIMPDNFHTLLPHKNVFDSNTI